MYVPVLTLVTEPLKFGPGIEPLELNPDKVALVPVVPLR